MKNIIDSYESRYLKSWRNRRNKHPEWMWVIVWKRPFDILSVDLTDDLTGPFPAPFHLFLPVSPFIQSNFLSSPRRPLLSTQTEAIYEIWLHWLTRTIFARKSRLHLYRTKKIDKRPLRSHLWILDVNYPCRLKGPNIASDHLLSTFSYSVYKTPFFNVADGAKSAVILDRSIRQVISKCRVIFFVSSVFC